MLTGAERTAWLDARRGGIGGSDAPMVMGLSTRWNSPYKLFLDKAGLIPHDDEENEEAYWGKVFEAPIANRYVQKTGRMLLPGLEMARHPECDYLFANTDRLIADPQGREHATQDGIPPSACAVYEGKTASAYLREKWDDGKVPLTYQVQMQHYLCVSGLEWGSFACLIGGQRLVWVDVERNDRFIQAYLIKAAEFWARVQNNDPPPLEGHPADRKGLDALYGQETAGKVIDLGPEVAQWAEALAAAKGAEKAAQADKDRYDTLIRGAMRDALFGRLPDGSGFKLALEHKKEHVRKASSSRVLRKVKRVP